MAPKKDFGKRKKNSSETSSEQKPATKKKVEITDLPKTASNNSGIEPIDIHQGSALVNKYFEPVQFESGTAGEQSLRDKRKLSRDNVKAVWDEVNRVTGKNYNPFGTDAEQKEAQRGYNEYLVAKGKEGKMSDKEIEQLITTEGFTKDGAANDIDGFITDKTGAFDYSGSRKIFNLKPQTPTNTVVTEGSKQVAGDIKNNGVKIKNNNIPAKFWTEDLNNISGAASDLNRLKKYMPWQAPLNVELPTATYYDPTRELAANAEQANIAAQALASFSGPQSLAARLASTQGKASSNAADILAKYNTMNVKTANDLEQSRNQIINQNYANQQKLSTDMYDKMTVANQQFDNSKTQARQKLRDMVNAAWTNRGQTQSLNATQNDFYVDPTTGFTNITNPDYLTRIQQGAKNNTGQNITNPDYLAKMKQRTEMLKQLKNSEEDYTDDQIKMILNTKKYGGGLKKFTR